MRAPESMNVPASDLPQSQPRRRRDFRDTMQWRIFRIMAEFIEGFQFIGDYPRTVSIFGSARFTEDDVHYQQARDLAKKLVDEGFSIVTGGGPGIMEAANRGAKEAGGESVGLNIMLPKQQERANSFVEYSRSFHYFFTRKVMLSYAAEAYVFFPGGFGTLDEFFEILTLVQTKIIDPLPLICVGRDYWEPLLGFVEDTVLHRHQAINPEHAALFHITDDLDEATEIIGKAPTRIEA